jgi:sterol desaturase/sphingolipid hydroxylase (fatty acid hydroxylase superfamily)
MNWLQQLGEFFNLQLLLIVALIFIPLERMFALHPKQLILRRFWWNDIIYILVNRIPIFFAMATILVAAIAASAWIVPQSVRDWVSTLALWIQVLAALLIADLGFYAAHRLFHSVPFLWRFHAVHHSIEEMDWLAAARVHPVDQIITKALSLIPLFMLGFSVEAIGIHSLIYLVQSYLVHANLRLKIGPLRWLIASPEFHHWHHSNQREAYDKNFAGQLPFLDLLFGTMHMPPGEMPTHYGVDEPVPTTYFKQMVYPFKKKSN